MDATARRQNRVAHGALVVAGFACLALAGVGVVVPGLPTTVFVLGAAACFARSSPRLERWLLGLPGIGRLVEDHRAGLGMPRRAKLAAIASMLAFSTIAVVAADHLLVQIAVAVAAVLGAVVVGWRVPTRERVLATPP